MDTSKLVCLLFIACISECVDNDCPRHQRGPACTCKAQGRRIDILCTVTTLSELPYLPYCNDTSRSKDLKILLNLIPNLPSSSLSCRNVTSLFVSGERLTFVGSGAFNGLEQTLRFLYLGQSSLQYIPLPAVNRLSRLRTLNLENNHITALNSSLRDLPLKNLVLSSNEISTIEPNKFPSKLKSLSLMDNYIPSLNFSLTRGVSKLRRLYLSKNRIHSLDWELNDLPRLKLLDVSHNVILSIDREALSKLSNLEVLDLSYNRIYRILNELRGLSRLFMLNLSSNALAYVHVDALGDLTNLDTLDLTNNRLQSISEGALDCLTSLKYLDVSNNDLKNLDFLNPLEDADNLNLNLAGDSQRSPSRNVTSCAFREYGTLEYFRMSGNSMVCGKKIWGTLRTMRSRGVSVRGNPCRNRG